MPTPDVWICAKLWTHVLGLKKLFFLDLLYCITIIKTKKNLNWPENSFWCIQLKVGKFMFFAHHSLLKILLLIQSSCIHKIEKKYPLLWRLWQVALFTSYLCYCVHNYIQRVRCCQQQVLIMLYSCYRVPTLHCMHRTFHTPTQHFRPCLA